MFAHIMSLIVAPIIVGIAVGIPLKLFSHWLDEKDKDDDR